jgi:hypothetical protein
VPDVSIAQLMQDLGDAKQRVEAASDHLYNLTNKFEGFSASGEMGVRLTWEALVEEEACRIYDEYEESGKKIPPEPIRKQRAIRICKAEHPELYVRYHKMRSEIEATQKWLSSYRDAISAAQSVLSTEKELIKGVPPGPQPEWSK